MEPASHAAVVEPPSDRPVVRVEGLVNRFGAQVVHDGLSLEVRANEIFGIVGGSGAGKSVLLRTILGLRQPQAGTVEVFGRDIRHLTAEERLAMSRSYGVTFQSGALISSLSVAQNIQLPLREMYTLSEEALDDLVQLNLSLVRARSRCRQQVSGATLRRYGQTRRARPRARPRAQAAVPG